MASLTIQFFTKIQATHNISISGNTVMIFQCYLRSGAKNEQKAIKILRFNLKMLNISKYDNFKEIAQRLLQGSLCI